MPRKKKEVNIETPMVNDEVVEAAKIQAEQKSEQLKLKIKIAFSDKYTGVDYAVGDVIPFEEKRAAELLADPRKLVSKA